MLKPKYLLLIAVSFFSLNCLLSQSDSFADLINKDYFKTTYFGIQGFQVLDIDNDGKQEIVAAVNQTSSYVGIYTYTYIGRCPMSMTHLFGATQALSF